MIIEELSALNYEHMHTIAREHRKELGDHLPYDKGVLLNWILHYIRGGMPQTRVYMALSNKGRPMGYLMLHILPYFFNDRVYISQEYIYVRKRYRKTPAGFYLSAKVEAIANLLDPPAVQIIAGVSHNDEKLMHRAEKFLAKKGYVQKGVYFVKEIVDDTRVDDQRHKQEAA